MAQLRDAKYNIPNYGKSYALLSRATDVDTAVVFVHGFGGDPVKTWLNFQGLVDQYAASYPWWTTTDMFFYSYDSVHTPIRYNTTLLGNFVHDIWNQKWWPADPAANRKYNDLIFAGHSEGGALVRRLILDRYQAIEAQVKTANPGANAEDLCKALDSALKGDFILNAYLRLFAPAYMGINFSSKIGFLSSFSSFVAAITATSVVKNELVHTSPVLTQLRAGTEQAHAASPQVRSLYTQPLFGVTDQVVFSDSYQGEEPLWDKGYDHFSICKPDYLHLRPLEFVKK